MEDDWIVDDFTGYAEDLREAIKGENNELQA
jgi:hypothetical protein